MRWERDGRGAGCVSPASRGASAGAAQEMPSDSGAPGWTPESLGAVAGTGGVAVRPWRRGPRDRALSEPSWCPSLPRACDLGHGAPRFGGPGLYGLDLKAGREVEWLVNLRSKAPRRDPPTIMSYEAVRTRKGQCREGREPPQTPALPRPRLHGGRRTPTLPSLGLWLARTPARSWPPTRGTRPGPGRSGSCRAPRDRGREPAEKGVEVHH